MAVCVEDAKFRNLPRLAVPPTLKKSRVRRCAGRSERRFNDYFQCFQVRSSFLRELTFLFFFYRFVAGLLFFPLVQRLADFRLLAVQLLCCFSRRQRLTQLRPAGPALRAGAVRPGATASPLGQGSSVTSLRERRTQFFSNDVWQSAGPHFHTRWSGRGTQISFVIILTS